MSNDELKKKLLELKSKKKNIEEEKKLKAEIKQLEEETREKSKTEKTLKVVSKGFIGFAKVSNKFFEKQYKKQAKKSKK